ncbi:MAG TPA: ScyD/ScyE family protein [Gaiellaceae bacterium]|nr:ScyD/ScyE family protein [Gaiellaceae bacterium]
MRRMAGAGAALAAAAALVVGAGGAGAARTPAHAAQWTVATVATGLDSPRGLVFASDGTLYVAEAGHGGDVCTSAGPLGEHCIGTSSQVTKVDPASGTLTPVVKGLFSRSVTLEGITGIDGVSAWGGKLLGAITSFPEQYDDWSCDGQPADCGAVLAAAKAQAGKLVRFTPGGTWTPVADVGVHDIGVMERFPGLAGPDVGPGPNSNPYGVLALPTGAWVADSGSDLLDWIPDSGDIDVAGVVPPPPPGGFPADGVPTCLALVDGNLYAGDLAGRVWTRPTRGGSLTPIEVPVNDASGKALLHHVTGCAADEDGNLYFVDMWGTPGPPIPAGPESAAGTGSVVELAHGGAASVLATGLDFPNGIAVAKDGSVYVSVGSTCTAQGTPFPYCAQGGKIVRLVSG